MEWPINTAKPHIMHIDLNSCFSTIEQQANPLIRNKPVAVGAYTHGHGMILAASYDAKAKGIVLGTKVSDARRICPGIVVLMPDPPKYREAHRRFKEVLLQYTSDVVPKSIDEFVIDFSGSEALRSGKNLTDIGYEIKAKIRDSLGEYVTVNVGIGPNRFLAKLAAGLHKPDGLDAIDHTNLIDTLQSVSLRALPGINRRFEARLRAAGIADPYEFFLADGKFLKNFVFYSKLGHLWHQRLRGWEVDDVTWGRKTIGHQYALQDKTNDRAKLHRLFMKLTEKIGRRLRKANYTAQGIHLSIRFVGFTYWHKGHTTRHTLYATQEIYEAAKQLLDEAPLLEKVSLVSITIFNLRPASPEQLGLFDNTRLKRKALAQAADIVNDHFGEFTVVPAIMANMNGTILDRIAFGGIRDM